MQHPDDEFHPPTSDDPYWTETCWFTFTVPERRLSGQLYPFFRTNQGVLAAGVFFWDELGATPADARYARQFWHLPVPDQPLSDIRLPNGIAYRCTEPQRRWELAYDDPDTDDPELGVSVRLTFAAVARPNYLGESHLDQPGRYEGCHPVRRGHRRRRLRVPGPLLGPSLAVRARHPRHAGRPRRLQLRHGLRARTAST